MKATINYLAIFERKRGFNGDNRKYGMYTVFSYYTNSGIEYRRAYWFADGTPENGIFQRVPQAIDVTIE